MIYIKNVGNGSQKSFCTTIDAKAFLHSATKLQLVGVTKHDGGHQTILVKLTSFDSPLVR